MNDNNLQRKLKKKTNKNMKMTYKEKLIIIRDVLTDNDRKNILLILKDLNELRKTNSIRELKFYISSLMYKKNAGNIHMYVNDKVLSKIINFNTSHPNWEVIDNKITFSEKMSQIPNSVPMYLGKIDKGFIYDNKGNNILLKSKADLIPIIKRLTQSYGVVFVKKTGSCGGKDVFRFNETSNFNLEKINLQDEYLIQKGLTQHNTLNTINPHCINTLRVITLNRNGETNITSCLFRMGINGSYKDNASSGGIFVGYDIEKNKLDKVATKFLNKGGTSYYSHPETHYVFKNQALPYPEKVISLVKDAAKIFSDRYVIGWDVAYTPEGPVIIEGNTNPCPMGMQIALRGLRNVKIYDDIYQEFQN